MKLNPSLYYENNCCINFSRQLGSNGLKLIQLNDNWKQVVMEELSILHNVWTIIIL